MPERRLDLLHCPATLYEPRREGVTQIVEPDGLDRRGCRRGLQGASEGVPFQVPEDVAVGFGPRRQQEPVTAPGEGGIGVRTKRDLAPPTALDYLPPNRIPLRGVILHGERRKKQAQSENDREPDPAQWAPRWGWLAGSLSDDGRSQESAALVEYVYSITRSARSRIDCGIVKPSALAVLRLITSSNLVDCSIGRSAGFAPLRILSTKVAARRNMSGRLTPYDNRPPASVTSRNVDTVAS